MYLDEQLENSKGEKILKEKKVKYGNYGCRG